MNKLLLKLKKSNVKLPIRIGQLLSYIPFSKRPGIGKNYSISKQNIAIYAQSDKQAQQKIIFDRFYRVFEFAYENIPFYNQLYKEAGIGLEDINEFKDIQKIPIISKKDLIDVPLEERSFNIERGTIVNTGGSSGKPLSFYLDPYRFGNEWAHIHHIWAYLGYKPSLLRLHFDGRSNVQDYIQYDFVRHSLRYDIYANPKYATERLLEIVKKHPVYFLHGYPSAIYEFAIYCRDNNHDLLKLLKRTLKGAFLVSEFPNPHFRETISSVFDIPTQSFYGHTEACVMAYEKSELFRFHPLQSYGYAEAIMQEDNSYNLIGTSYYNFISPLIRYDTEDGIGLIKEDNGILSSFEIKEGRRGEYILDANGNKISLTGLIFGRHHKLFDVVKHIQVQQEKIGEATILYVPNELKTASLNESELLDSSNINIQFRFREITEPIKTKSGKINLLVK